jgi:hypothetical protein
MAMTQRPNELLVPLSELTTMLVAQTTYYQMLRWTVNNKLEGTWKEAVRASFPVLFWYLHVAKKVLETSVWTVCDLPDIWSTLSQQEEGVVSVEMENRGAMHYWVNRGDWETLQCDYCAVTVWDSTTSRWAVLGLQGINKCTVLEARK